MFPLLHKIIETRPSNNITYTGGLGKYNSGFYPKSTKENIPSFHLT